MYDDYALEEDFYAGPSGHANMHDYAHEEDFYAGPSGHANMGAYMPQMREYLVSPVAFVAVGGAVGLLSAMVGGRPGAYRIGIKDADGNVPFLWDFRTMAVIGAIAINWLPSIPALQGLPVIGSAMQALNRAEGVQDIAALAGMTAFVSLAATEGADMPQTGKFMGLPVPQMVQNMILPAPAPAQPSAPAAPAADGGEEIAIMDNEEADQAA